MVRLALHLIPGAFILAVSIFVLTVNGFACPMPARDGPSLVVWPGILPAVPMPYSGRDAL